MDCPYNIPSISYGEFSKRLYEDSVKKRIPISGSIELTERCNLKCVHCYINKPPDNRELLNREMSKTEIFNIIDQIVDMGCLWMLFTGGEPLLRPDFIEIYTYAKKAGLLVTIFTNGTLIDEKISDYFAEYCPFSVEITINGATEQTFEKITCVEGSYLQCLKGIELLSERKIPMKLKTMVLSLNKHELDDMRQLARNFEVDFRFDPIINFRLDGNDKPAEYRLTADDVLELDMNDSKRANSFKKSIKKYYGKTNKPEYIYKCGAGANSFHVDPYGRLSPCIMSRYPSYDLLNGSFSEGWLNFIPEVVSEKVTKVTKCTECEIIGICSLCPGISKMETGDPEGIVEYICNIAHKRVELFKD